MIDCRGDWIHTCYSGSRPWCTRVAEENGWSVTIRPSVLFFLPQWYLAVAFFLSHSRHQHVATNDMGVWMGRPWFLQLVSRWVADDSGVDGPNLATVQGWVAYDERLECHVHRRVPLRDPARDLSFLPLNLCCMNYLYELFVWIICMNYLYELFVFELPTHLCTASIVVFGVVFLCITINHWLGVLFNTNLCQHHAKIFIYSKPGGLFICSGINSLYRGKNSLYHGINYLYRGIPLHTVWTSSYKRFWFEIWIRAVFSGIPRYTAVQTVTAT
jgi:hypothetical protein